MTLLSSVIQPLLFSKLNFLPCLLLIELVDLHKLDLPEGFKKKIGDGPLRSKLVHVRYITTNNSNGGD